MSRVYVGMFRPTWDEAREAITRSGGKCPGCDMNVPSPANHYCIPWTLTREEHYQAGHFDTPVYEDSPCSASAA